MDKNFWLGVWFACIVFGTAVAMLVSIAMPNQVTGGIFALCLTIWWLSYKFLCKAKR